jgi:hypothetical protein
MLAFSMASKGKREGVLIKNLRRVSSG